MSNLSGGGIERGERGSGESFTDDATAVGPTTSVILIYFHAELISLDHVNTNSFFRSSLRNLWTNASKPLTVRHRQPVKCEPKWNNSKETCQNCISSNITHSLVIYQRYGKSASSDDSTGPRSCKNHNHYFECHLKRARSQKNKRNVHEVLRE